MKPSYYLCGAGGNIDCPHWDDVNGCWMDCKSFGDENCEAHLFDDEYCDDEGDYSS